MSPRDAALRYLELGFNPFPLGPRTKDAPLIKWKYLQQQHASIAEIHDWWRRWPTANVALVCGEISDLVVIDYDPRNGEEPSGIAWGSPPTVRTGGGGTHRYYAFSGVRTVHGLVPGLDLQSDASYVVAPPSVHPDGGVYTFVEGRALPDPFVGLPLLPVEIVELEIAATHYLPPERPPAPEGPWRGITLDDVLAVLEDTGKPTRVGPLQYMARCPLHDDQKASLAISLGDNGRLLLFCHAGCPFFALLNFFIRRVTGEVR